MISGRVLGPCHESTVPAIAFAISSGSEHERILLPREQSLPSISPFLLYRIRVEASMPGPLWHVVEVSSVDPLPVYQAELADALTLLFPHDSYVVREALMRDLAGRSDPLSPGDVPERQRIARELVLDAWQQPAFYKLLPYFPGKFLRTLDRDELAFALELFLRDPIIFAYWEVAKRALEASVRPEKLRASMEALCSRSGWRYDDRCPAMHPGHVEMLSTEAASVFRWPLLAEKAFHEKGDLVGPCPEEGVEHLEPYVMTFPRADGVGRSLVDPASASVQARLVILLGELDELRIVNCEAYDDVTLGKVRALEPEWRVCAARPPLESVFGPLRRAPKLAIVHAHKLGPKLMLQLLESGEVRELLLIGDASEIPAHYASGGGDLFRDLSEASPTLTEWNFAGSHQRSTLDSLAARSTTHLYMTLVTQEGLLRKVVMDWLTQRKSVTRTSRSRGVKTTIQVRPEQSWVILCSGEAKRAQLRAVLSLDEVRVGQRVHLLDSDEVGTLKRATSVSTRKAVTKKGYLYPEEDYEMQIDTGRRIIKVNRSETELEMSDIALTSRWVGPIVDAVLFVADDRSSIEEISGAVKYAKVQFSLITSRSEQLVELPRQRQSRDSMIPMMLLKRSE